jgi:hypothetical protein
VLVAVMAFWPTPPKPGWGWDRPGALAVDLNAPEYLNHLADGANEWFKKRPETRQDLEQRLREFRRGCDTLIAAPHPQLSDADRDWLVERCRVWSGKLDQHVADLQTGTELTRVRDAADETIRKLIQALRDRTSVAA